MKYMKLLETAPPLKAESLADGYRVLAEFNGTVLAGKKTLLGAQFVTWAWDYDRRGASNGHYYMEDYQTAKEDFTFRSGLMAREQVLTGSGWRSCARRHRASYAARAPPPTGRNPGASAFWTRFDPSYPNRSKIKYKKRDQALNSLCEGGADKGAAFTMPGIYLPPVPTSCTPRIIRRTLRPCRCAPAQTCAGAAPTQPMASSAGAPPGNACGLG